MKEQGKEEERGRGRMGRKGEDNRRRELPISREEKEKGEEGGERSG